jgi:methyltransferase (TIGR00027 family)
MTLRAAHQLIDDAPRILDDPVAVQLVGEEGRAALSRADSRVHSPGARTLRAHVVIRSRHAEDRLQAAVSRGVDQYVILGAGYDTFAWRQPEWTHALRIFEIDHPASQAAKRDRLSAVGLGQPENLIFAAVDFEHETLRDGLARAGFDFSRPAFVSCLGVLMYLTEAAAYGVFDFVRTLAPGSEIVATFRSARDGEEVGASPLAQAAAAVGEPWLSQFDPFALQAKLLADGFSVVDLVSGAELEVRYALKRRDGIAPGRGISTVRAIV